jgi:hypothetical protein
MRDDAKAAADLFGNYGYKAVRAALIRFAKNLAGAVEDIAAKIDRTYNENGLELKVRHSDLESLQDVDWIEDLMKESDMQPRKI